MKKFTEEEIEAIIKHCEKLLEYNPNTKDIQYPGRRGRDFKNQTIRIRGKKK